MSRIGKLEVPVAAGVTVDIKGQDFKVKGPKGELSMTAVDEVELERTATGVLVKPVDESQRARSMWGLTRTLIANQVEGVSKGFEKRMEITGVGYRAAAQGNKIQLSLGYSHEVVYQLPQGVSAQTPKPTEIVISGIDKQLVGQTAANIRKYRPPEPYKGKGVRIVGEHVIRKEGKKKK